MTPFDIRRIEESQIAEATDVIVRTFRHAGETAIDPAWENRCLTTLFNKAAEKKDGYVMLDCFVAMAGGRVIGTIECGTWYAPGADGQPACWEDAYWMTCLAVDPGWQGRGVGSALLKHAEDHVAQMLLKGRAGTLSFVDSTKKYHPGSLFYENRGYEPYGTFMDEPIVTKTLNTTTDSPPPAAGPA